MNKMVILTEQVVGFSIKIHGLYKHGGFNGIFHVFTNVKTIFPFYLILPSVLEAHTLTPRV